jgi:hypothetical protein
MDVYNAALELVKWLTTRTERQGLCWHIDGDIISARLRDATSIRFQVHCELSSPRTWSLLTVCNAGGIALRRVTPDALSDCNSGLVAAIDALFLAISHQMPLARPKDLPPRKESTRLRLRFECFRLFLSQFYLGKRPMSKSQPSEGAI